MAGKRTSNKRKTSQKPSVTKAKSNNHNHGFSLPAPERHRTPRPGQDFFVVGIGASAGGLEAFEQFFTNMPAKSGMSFVLIPHLSPEHKSMMVDLLKRYTDMDIHEAREGMEVKPDHVYIIPPNKDLAIANNVLLLQEPTASRGVRHPIDYFFRALAQDQGDHSICVILSGTGTEGTLGLRAVKGEGGLVLAQDIKDAKYDGMPSSAIATGLVDHVLPASEMPRLLLRYTKVTAAKTVKPLARVKEKPATEALQRIYTLLRAQTGHDFTLYKQNTVLRRIHKRMAIHQIEAFEDYIVYLRSNPHEIDILFNELLIRVTSFFRDPEAFESLTVSALPQLFDRKNDDDTVRIWVPGCSTGEEAYSIAFLCSEYQREHKGPHRKVQIFATDIDRGAIDIARAGNYSESITVDVSPERLSRYFTKRSGEYKVKDDIREMVVFAVQDLIKDPPFSKLDLISCRNVLIYMGTALQKRVLSLFHYALNANGVLFLGSSETVGDASDRFSVLDKKWKIFRARRVEILPIDAIELRQVLVSGGRAKVGIPASYTPPTVNIGDYTERLLLERYSPPCCMVNDKGDILYFHGKTGKYLEPASGKATLNIVEMAREGMRLEIRTGLRKAVTQKKDVVYAGLQVKSNGGYNRVDLEFKYISKPNNLEGLMMVVFNEANAPFEKKMSKEDKGKIESREKATKRIAAMEYELKSAKEHLQTTIEELETSNEELKSTNEELQSSNEELQSTNEELETSREELQSANEELITVNTELQHKIEELSDANSDIVNLLASTQIATLFLTYDLRIRRFTPSIADVINIIQSDIGRPIGDISFRVEYPDLISDAEEVLRNLSQKERYVRRQDDRWFLVRIVPYRSVDNMISGVVLTFVDFTQQKWAKELEEGLDVYLHDIVETAREPLLILDYGLHVLAANRSFFQMFSISAAETMNGHIYELCNGQFNIPPLEKLLEEVLASDAAFENYLVEHEFPNSGVKKMLLNARRIRHECFKTEMILLAIEDVTNK
jgi:two-component system CheB/CheR fusion protein